MEDTMGTKSVIPRGRPRDERNRNSKRRKRLLMILAVLLLLLLLGAGLYFWLNRDRALVIGANMTQGELDGYTTQDMLEYMQGLADEDHVTLQMNTRPVFYDSNSEAYLLIQNPTYNTYNMQVEIYLGRDDSGLLVYDSGMIPPGYYIEQDKLGTALEKGEHEAIGYLNFYDEDGEFVTRASANMTLVIEN